MVLVLFMIIFFTADDIDTLPAFIRFSDRLICLQCLSTNLEAWRKLVTYNIENLNVITLNHLITLLIHNSKICHLKYCIKGNWFPKGKAILQQVCSIHCRCFVNAYNYLELPFIKYQWYAIKHL